MSGMNQHAVPNLARLGAVAVALCLVVATVLAAPARAAEVMVAPATHPGDHQSAVLSQALSLVASGDRRPLRLAQGERPRVSLDEAVSKVRSRYKGRVIRAETRYGQDGRPTHYVKLLSSDGHVRTIRVDGRTGRVR